MRLAVAEVVDGDGGSAVETGPLICLEGGDHVSGIGHGGDHVGEIVRHGSVVQVKVVHGTGEVVAHRGEFLNAHTHHVTDGTGVATQPDVILVVHQTGVVGHEQLAAVRHILAHAARGLFGQDGQARQHDGFVLVPRAANRHHVCGQTVVRQRAEPRERLGPMAYLLSRRGGVFRSHWDS